ncbi:carbon-nitrogen family hydrolase [Robertmurraya beringensis]|uniref:Carbon-nitrogen family hydrolase n=1 Tax=Robertmurraya beringensis TaxID=641660 RepID=A0ABV6KVC0_9BACI|nr:Putative hydrolase [Mycobacteroides abscessus subsp. abscessus]
MRVSCIQMDISFGNVEENFQKAERLIESAMAEKPDLVILPELWTTGYDLTRLDVLADLEAKKSIEFLQKLAKKHHVHIVGGSVASQENNGVYNTMLVISNEGELVSTYSKAHLFKLMNEHEHLQSGSTNGMFALDKNLFAGFICYDIRFPEWIRAHTTEGAETIVVVAEWPLPRLNHWRSLLIARAIENQCFVIACNRSGSDPDNVFAGHSLIINPWGEVIAEGDELESIVTGQIDLAEVKKVRNTIPIFSDRRTDLY